METPHLRIAITTDSLVNLDSNFAATKQMVFYNVTPDSSEFVDVVHFGKGGKKGVGGGKGGEGGVCIMDDVGDESVGNYDPMQEKLEALKGSSVLFTLGLSDLAAVRVHGMRIFPVKTERARSIDDVLENVQRLMGGVPPLWMRRVMRDAAGDRLALDDQEI
jgi:nitrogen fixation protein NifX